MRRSRALRALALGTLLASSAAYPGERTAYIAIGSGEKYDSLGTNGSTFICAVLDYSRSLELEAITQTYGSASASSFLSPEAFHLSASHRFELMPNSRLRPFINAGLGIGTNYTFARIVAPAFGPFINVEVGFQLDLGKILVRAWHKSEGFVFRGRDTQVATGLLLVGVGMEL